MHHGMPGFFPTLKGALSDIPLAEPVTDELSWIARFNERKLRMGAKFSSTRLTALWPLPGSSAISLAAALHPLIVADIDDRSGQREHAHRRRADAVVAAGGDGDRID